MVSSLEFAAPLSGQTKFELLLPKDFKDASGRTLANADGFPLALATGDLPPLAKFAAAPFGIVERFAEGPPSDNPPALLPVTLRKVEAALQVSGLQAVRYSHAATRKSSPGCARCGAMTTTRCRVHRRGAT